MDHGIVQTHFLALLQRLVVMITDSICIAGTHRKMAGGILIEQSFIEQKAAAADGAVLRHQGAFAKVHDIIAEEKNFYGIMLSYL